MRTLLAAVCAAFLLSACQTASAQTSPVRECPSNTFSTEWVAGFLNQYAFVERYVIDADLAKVVTRNFNALPPASNFETDRVVVYSNAGYGMLVLYMGGCATSPGPMPFSVFEQFMRQMVGQGV